MLFSLGQTGATPGVLDLIELGAVNLNTLLHRHACGDWGDLDAEDKALNDAAVKTGDRILSSYKVGENVVWIITEGADLDLVTTLLLPSEY
jgi:hypothetical protein